MTDDYNEELDEQEEKDEDEDEDENIRITSSLKIKKHTTFGGKQNVYFCGIYSYY